MAIVGDGRASRSPKGPYDKGILCGKCDSEVLNNFDQHAAKMLLQSQPVHLPHVKDCSFYPDAKPTILHGFATSVAWRASISSHAFFSRVKLNSYENICQRSFLGDKDAQDKLEICIVEFDKHDVPITDPYHTQLGNVEFLVLQAAWFQFWIKVDDQPLPPELSAYALREDRRIISIVRSWRDSKQRKAMQEHFKDEPRPKFWKT